MIISASRRTDIPAFYSCWFMNAVRRGSVAVPNPMNPRQISWVSLLPSDVDVLVFWTPNASPLMPDIRELELRQYRFYFQYTITGYPLLFEPRAPALSDALTTFRG